VEIIYLYYKDYFEKTASAWGAIRYRIQSAIWSLWTRILFHMPLFVSVLVIIVRRAGSVDVRSKPVWEDRV